MARKSSVTVSAKTVRAFFQANPKAVQAVLDANEKVTANSVLGADGDASRIRGRIHPAFRAAYEAATGNTYAEVPAGGVTEVKMVEIPRVGKNGRPIKSVSMPLAEARVLAGHAPNRKGVLSSADLAKVAAAL